MTILCILFCLWLFAKPKEQSFRRMPIQTLSIMSAVRQNQPFIIIYVVAFGYLLNSKTDHSGGSPNQSRQPYPEFFKTLGQ